MTLIPLLRPRHGSRALRACGRVRLALAAVVLAVGIGSIACGRAGPSEAELRETLVPVAGFRNFEPDLVVGDGPMPEPRWVQVDGTPVPALVASWDSVLSIRVGDLGATSIEGSVGLLRLERSDPAQVVVRATFRIRARSDLDDPGSVLWERELSDSGGAVPLREPFAVTLAESREEAAGGHVTLELDYSGKPGSSPEAAWIDPVLKGSREVPPVRADAPWNVLLITSDTTRRDALSCYGGAGRTPSLDRLAEEGIVFDNAFSVAFGTTPSHASLLTASRAADHGVYDNETVLGDRHVTLPEILREHGYVTAAFVSARPVARSLGFAQGFDLYDDLFLEGGETGGIYAQHERRAGTTSSRFLDWLGERGERPFFAWLHYFDPHQPYAPPAEVAEGRLDETPAVRRVFETEDGELNYLHAREVLAAHEDLFPDLVVAAARRYALEVEYLDSQIGRVLDRLRETGADRDTLVVYVGDHGENFVERDRGLAFNHASVLDPVSRVPLIVRTPSSPDSRGARSASLVTTADVAPTVLDILGIEAPSAWTGRSFEGLLSRPGRPFRSSVVLEGAHEHEIGVRTERWLYREIVPEHRGDREVWEYLSYGEEPIECFDVASDPSTRRPVDPRECTELGRLRATAERFLSTKGSVEARTLRDEEHREGLKALGYLR